MKKKFSIEIGVDEFTIVLQPNRNCFRYEEWEFYAELMIDDFIDRSKLETILDTIMSADDSKTNPAGYNTAVFAQKKPYYLSIAYHKDYPNMGVIVKFSAFAWADYQKCYRDIMGHDIDLRMFLDSIRYEKLYSFRLSRIDIAVDYKDYFSEDFLNSLYNDYSEGNIKIVNADYKQNIRETKANITNKEVNTIYIGSLRSRSFLRVYNKKKEQIDTNGFRLNEAENCDSWIRFEASYRDIYAHQLTEKLLEDTQDYQTLLIEAFLSKYRFYDENKGSLCSFTKILVDLLSQDTNILRCESPRNNSILRSIQYLITDSGLLSTLVKVFLIWGDRADEQLFDLLKRSYYKQKPDLIEKKEITAFVDKHKSTLKKTPFRKYIRSVSID